MDRWQSQVIVCKGGLNQSEDQLTQGSVLTGEATILQNYEPALEGGYGRIEGFAKFDTNAVTGNTTAPVLGVKVAHGGIYAARKNVAGTSVDIFKSTGSGWGTKINTANQASGATKYRIISYSITEEVVIFCDSLGPALKYNDTTDTLINGTGAPSDPTFAEMVRSRLVLSGYSANTSAISISAPNVDTEFNGVNGAIEINVGDTVVGLKTFRDTLYIFCERSVFRLTGNSNANFAVEAVTRGIGCISGDSIQEIAGDLLFLAPDGLRSVAATERIGDVELGLKSRKIQSTIEKLVGAVPGENFSSVTVRKKSQYRLFVQESGLADSESAGILGKYELDGSVSWATILGMNVYSADSEYDSDNEFVVFGHPTNGFVYRQESGNSFAGSNIVHIYNSPQITFEDATIRKVFQKATIYTEATGDLGVDLSLILDYGESTVLQPNSISLTQTGDTPVYGTAVYGTDEYGAATFPVFKKNLQGSGFTCAFSFAGTNQLAPHRIDSYQIQFALKGRR